MTPLQRFLFFFFIKFWKQSCPCSSNGEFTPPSGERILNCHFCFDSYSIKMQQLNLHQLRKWIICFLSLWNLVLVSCWIGNLLPFQSRTWVVQPPPDVHWQCRLHGQIQVWSWASRFSGKQCPWRNHKPRERKFYIPVWLMRVDKEAVGEVPWTWCGSFQNIQFLLIDKLWIFNKLSLSFH